MGPDIFGRGDPFGRASAELRLRRGWLDWLPWRTPAPPAEGGGPTEFGDLVEAPLEGPTELGEPDEAPPIPLGPIELGESGDAAIDPARQTREVARQFADAMRARCPVDTGALRASITVIDTADGAYVTIGGGEVDYARPVMARNPFVWDARASVPGADAIELVAL